MSKTGFVSLAALLVIAGAGCTVSLAGGDGPGDSDTIVAGKATPAAAEQARPVKTPTPPPVAPIDLSVAVLTAADVGHGVEEQDRDQGLATATNDICAKQWPSNDDRIDREQVFYWKGDVGERVVSNEVIAYREGTGAAAMEEIRVAVSGCPGWKHREGELTDIAVAAIPGGARGLVTSFAWEATDHRTAGQKTYAYLAVYHLQDDLLSALYLWAPSAAEARELADELTPKTDNRLQAATAR